MPRYFIDTDDGDVQRRDDIGHELPDIETARVAVLDALPDLARSKMPDGDQRIFVVTVRNAGGKTLYTARLRLDGQWVSRAD